MRQKLLGFFRTGPDKPLISNDPEVIRRDYEKRRWSVFLSLTFGYGFFYVARTNIGVVKQPLLDAGLFEADELGMIGTALFVTYMIGKTLNGFLSDRANIRRFMSTALLLSAIANLVIGFHSLFAVFFVMWGLNGLFQSVGSAPSGASLRQWFSNREYGTRYGIWSASHGIGTAITFYVTSQVVEAYGWEWGFWGPGVLCLLVAVVLFRTLMDRPRTYGLPTVADYKDDHPTANAEEAAGDAGAADAATAEAAAENDAASVNAAQVSVLKNPAVWIMGMASALMYVSRYGINSWGPMYLQNTRGYGLGDAGLALTVYTIATVAGAVSSGAISDRLFGSRRNWPALISGLLILVSLLTLHFGPDEVPGVVWGSLSVFGFALGAQLAYLGGLWAVDISPPRAAGAAMGMIGGFSYAGAAIQDTVSGFLIKAGKTTVNGVDHYDLTPAFWFWFGTAVLSTVLVLFVWNAKPRA